MMESKESKEDDGAWEHIEFKELEVGERIGGGGVGVIYKGWFRNQPVALKTLFDTRVSEDLKNEYMDELLVMSKVRHSNIVDFLGACMAAPNWCFVMELCDTSLFNILHQDRVSISHNDKLQMAVDVGSAMEYLHSLKPAIVHRDLKSHNVLRSHDGKLKVCDFGLVKVRNTQAGTPAYMAPELLEGKSFSKSVDVYAFAVLFNEIMDGEIPFNGVQIPDIRDRVVRGDRPHTSPSHMPSPACNDVVSRGWSQKAEDRPDFTEVVDMLLDIYDALPAQRHLDNLDAGGGDVLDSIMGFK
jgi:serine/threonine protein kinase